MSYGLPYTGSKNRIAKWVVSHLPAAHDLVDLFAGGCAVTHCAMLSGKFKRIIANDRTRMPYFFKEAVDGDFENFDQVCDREQFQKLKNIDPVVALIYSFGYDQRSFSYGVNKQDVMNAVDHMIISPDMHSRKIWYERFISLLAQKLSESKTPPQQTLFTVQRPETAERIERIQSLHNLASHENLAKLTVLQLDYSDVPIPAGATVYADPPYRNTGHDYGHAFDFDRFDQWLANVPFPVITSEYTAPKGTVEIAEQPVQKLMSASAKAHSEKVTEKLFIQKRFAKQYESKEAQHVRESQSVASRQDR